MDNYSKIFQFHNFIFYIVHILQLFKMLFKFVIFSRYMPVYGNFGRLWGGYQLLYAGFRPGTSFHSGRYGICAKKKAYKRL